MIKYLERGSFRRRRSWPQQKLTAPVTTRRLKLLLTTGHNQTPSHSREKFRSFVDFSIARKRPLLPLPFNLCKLNRVPGLHFRLFEVFEVIRGISDRLLFQFRVTSYRQLCRAAVIIVGQRSILGEELFLDLVSPRRKFRRSCKRHRSSCQSFQTLMIIGGMKMRF